MAVLTTKTRNKLKSKVFGLPGERKYPMPDRSHAANAKARATQQVKAGNLSAAEKEKIDAKANRVLKKTAPKKENPNAQIRHYTRPTKKKNNARADGMSNVHNYMSSKT